MITLTVDPAADFGERWGHVVIEPVPDGSPQVVHADPVVYFLKAWMLEVKAGKVPWAELYRDPPWAWEDGAPVIGALLRLRFSNRTVLYRVDGGCGPTVDAYLCRWPE